MKLPWSLEFDLFRRRMLVMVSEVRIRVGVLILVPRLFEFYTSQLHTLSISHRNCQTSLIMLMPLLLACDDFCCLLLTLANSLDPDPNIGPGLDPNGFTLCWYKMMMIKKSVDDKTPNKTKKQQRKTCKITQYAKTKIVAKSS